MAFRKAQALRSGLKAGIHQKLVRRYPGLVLEELSQIVVVERQCAQVLVKLIILVRITENNILGDLFHNGIS